MTQPYQPYPAAASDPEPGAKPRKSRRGAAITALVLGIVALCGSPIPILNNATIIAGIIGIVFGVIATFGRHWKMAMAGLALAIAGIVAGIILQVQWGKQLDQIGRDLQGGSPASSAPGAPAADADHWEFEVTTTGSGISNVTYLKPGFNIAQDTAVKGNTWSTTLDGDYGYSSPNMSAQNEKSGTITCTITHNGQVVATNSSSGAYAVVTCQ